MVARSPFPVYLNVANLLRSEKSLRVGKDHARVLVPQPDGQFLHKFRDKGF